MLIIDNHVLYKLTKKAASVSNSLHVSIINLFVINAIGLFSNFTKINHIFAQTIRFRLICPENFLRTTMLYISDNLIVVYVIFRDNKLF